MRSCFISVGILIFLPVILIAQSNYKKGFIVSEQGDTLQGFINYQEWTRNPATFSFKERLDETQGKILDKFNTKLVSISGLATYEKAVTAISMNEVRFEFYTEGQQYPRVTDTIFLRLVTNGDKIKLFSYRDKLKERFYILEKQDSKLYELEYAILVQNNQVVTSYGYRQQLAALAKKYQITESMLPALIETAAYVRPNLRKIVNRINSVTENPVDELVLRSKRSRFFVNAGISSMQIKYAGQNMVTANGLASDGHAGYSNRQTNSFFPKIGAGFDFVFFPAIKRSLFRLEFSASGASSKVFSTFQGSSNSSEIISNEYNLSGIFLGLTPQIGYHIYNGENLKVNLGLGLMLRYAIYPKQSIFEDTNQQGQGYSDRLIKAYYKMRKTSAPLSLSAGVLANKKVEFLLSWLNPVELTQTQDVNIYSVKGSSAALSISYFFSRL